jgi:hypothetical protein
MKTETDRRVITVETHTASFDLQDILFALNQVNPDEVPEDASPRAVVALGTGIIDSTQLLLALRQLNGEIPEEAEVGISIKWRVEKEGPPPAPPQQPQQHQAPPQVIYAAPPQQHYQPPPGPQYPQAPQNAAQCRTCGGVPNVHGPTPGCMDAQGCGHVLRTRGQPMIPRTVPPQGAPQVGLGGAAFAPPGRLINRETGEQVFADKNGMPYGRHEDYSTR